jgi:redox-sensitive bicupin YhaK (pirin superfamily)
VRVLAGEVDAKDVTTRTVIPSSSMAFWSPFVRVGETIATPRKRFGTHTHERQEVMIYLIEGAAQHSSGTGGAEDLLNGSVLLLSAIPSAAHAVNPRPGHTARWFSIVVELPPEIPGEGGRRVGRTQPSATQPDGTKLTPLVGPGAPSVSRLGMEVTAIDFIESGTSFQKVGQHHRSLFYALAGRGTVDNSPVEVGEAALVENSAAVSVSGGAGFRVVHATVPFRS